MTDHGTRRAKVHRRFRSLSELNELIGRLLAKSDLNTQGKRAADGRFQNFVDQQTPVEKDLPLVHITRAYSFADLLKRGSLDPQHCEDFDERLVFAFWGRPAYRAKDGNNA